MKNLFSFLTGYMKVCIQGGQTERFLNLCMARGIALWSLMGDPKKELVFFISVRHFFLLGPIRRKTRVKIHILEKHGLPFFFAYSRKRKAFFLGFLVFGILLFFLSGRIWNIHIEGNITNSTPEILEFLEEEGVLHGISKTSVNCSSVAAKIREKYPKTAWVAAKIQGTRLIITIKEGVFSDTDKTLDREPCNLVASEDGIIVDMVTRSGTPQTEPGKKCKKGQLLVMGRLDLHNDSQEIYQYKYVHADADIYIRRQIPYYAELPMKYEKAIPIEKEKRRFYIKAGSLYMEWGRPPKKNNDCIVEDFPLRITENFFLPVSFGKITDRKYKNQRFLRTEQEAKAAAFHILQQYEKKIMEKGVQIFSNNVKIEVDHLTCISRGTLEIIEKTGREVPIEKQEQPDLQLERTTENG